jgi:tRNA-2-methylthio-N6-dimethylallyladenosine synthase
VAALKEAEWGAVSHEVKVERLERLQAVQRRISGEIGAALVGQEVEVLVEGPSKSHPSRRFGRTPENRTVNFDGTAPAGARTQVRVTHGSPSALLGVEVA